MKSICSRIATYPLLIMVGLLTISTVVLAPVASAQVIHACVNNSSGIIHVIATNGPCTSNETLLSWSLHGITGYQIVTHQVFLAAGEPGTNVHVDCPAGKKVLGGGYDIETPDFVKVSSSEPTDGSGNISDHSWNVFVRNDDTANSRQTTVSAICAVLD
jgi:hypothetical protein